MKYPVNGPREPVYNLMRGLGFSMSDFSDKFWNSQDGIEVSIFGAGSMARVGPRHDASKFLECRLDDLSERINELRTK